MHRFKSAFKYAIIAALLAIPSAAAAAELLDDGCSCEGGCHCEKCDCPGCKKD